MRIAFDIDGLLVPMNSEFLVDKPSGLLAAFLSRESLRTGAVPLMKELISRGHRIWIYTTSERSENYLRRWFAREGIGLDGVVNSSVHMEWFRSQGSAISCSKYPPAFATDLLIDDSEGVFLEGQRHGFAVVRIDPVDPNWTTRVLQTVEAMSGGPEK